MKAVAGFSVKFFGCLAVLCELSHIHMIPFCFVQIISHVSPYDVGLSALSLFQRMLI